MDAASWATVLRRADIVLLALAASGCFLDHGLDGPGAEEPTTRLERTTPAERAPESWPAVYDAVCAPGPSAEILELVFYSPACTCGSWFECTTEIVEATPDARRRLEVDTDAGHTAAACACVEDAPHELGRCELPSLAVGDWVLRVDDGPDIPFVVPYADPYDLQARCWSANGTCPTGTAGTMFWPTSELVAGRAATAEVVVDPPPGESGPPSVCTVHAERDRLRIDLRFGPPDETVECPGWGRSASCTIPPLEPGTYAVIIEDREAAELILE